MGFTLIEMLAAAVILAMLAGGTLMSFVTASRIASQNTDRTEAGYLAQQTLEKYRNRIACSVDATEAGNKLAWYDNSAACLHNEPPGLNNESLPVTTPATVATSRKFWVNPIDCDGDGTTGDCLSIKVQVSY